MNTIAKGFARFDWTSIATGAGATERHGNFPRDDHAAGK